MPELPEVETMVRGLRPALEGRTLGALVVRDEQILKGSATTTAQIKEMQGARVDVVTRRGKWVVIGTSSGLLVIQPRMTGGFRTVPPERPEHVRLVLPVRDPEGTVWFTDARRLARLTRFDDPEQADAAFARSHGPDALTIPPDELAARLARTRRSIKPTLMDQKVLAGIGNIYADEVLFRARVHPEHPADRLSHAQIGRIHAAIGAVLAEAITAEGSSFDAGYKTVIGLDGGFLARNAMYGRAGLPCPGCNQPIIRAKIAGLIGRSTYFCPACQAKHST